MPILAEVSGMPRFRKCQSLPPSKAYLPDLGFLDLKNELASLL
jgi:hypothetical protein